jgi:hypothetical protein
MRFASVSEIRFRRFIAYSLKFHRILEAGRKRIRAGKGIPHDEFWRGIDQPVKKRKKSLK